MNIKLRRRAIELLNRKNVVYARYTNFLKFTYKKYNVRSSKELKTNLRELEQYKHLNNRVDSVRKVMNESEKEIDEFLREHKIPNDKISLLNFAETINIDNQKRYFDNLIKEKSVAEESLESLDEKHKICWDKLMELKESDITSTKIITEMIKTYYIEIDKLMEEYNDDIDK